MDSGRSLCRQTLRDTDALKNTPLFVYSAPRLTLGPTEFLTRRRVSLREFEASLARLCA